MNSGSDDVADLRRAINRLYSRFRSERAEGEVGESALLVLVLLLKHEPLSLTDLASAARVTLGSMTQTVRRLEQLAFVVKTRDTADRRKVLFTLTEAGRSAADASRRHREEWLTRRLDALTSSDRAALARAIPLLLHIADS